MHKAMRPTVRGYRGVTTTRKSSKKKGKGRKVVIGKDNGLIITGKSPGITKAGASIRQSYHSDPSVSSANRLWVGGNSISDERFLLDLVVEGMVEHLLRRAGDTRSTKTQAYSSNQEMIFQSMQMVFVRRPSIIDTTAAQVKRTIRYDLSPQSSSFNGIVYNGRTVGNTGPEGPGPLPPGLSPNLMYEELSTSPLPLLESTLQYQIFHNARDGYYPEGVMLIRADTAGARHEFLRDQLFGSMKLKIDISGRYRFQNVTPASTTSGGSEGMNANLIDANPVAGKIFTFSNLSPRLAPSWILGQTDMTVLKEFEELYGRPYTWAETRYEQLSQKTIITPDTNQFEAAPLRPKTVWSNCKTSGPVMFPPGGFKTFKTKFTYNGTLNKFCQNLVQTQGDPVTFAAGDVIGKYPSMGDSFMMCLRPVMKTTGDEAVTMAYDYERIGKVQCAKFVHGTMPATNDIE